MKKIIALLTVVGLSATAFAQGELVFDHFNSGGGQILDVTGAPITGTDFSGQLFGGPNGGTLGAATVKGTTDAAVYPFYGALRAGYLNTGFITVVIPGVDPNTSADVQLRVWHNNGGALTDWADVEMNGASQQNVSEIVATAPLGGPNPDGPAFIAPALPAIAGFQLVPEPTTWALLGLGALALCFRRRK